MGLDLNDEATAALREMVEEWIDDGFTTPPYTPAQYDVFEALGLTEPLGLCGYDIRRPPTVDCH